jgi:hypothetical protein
VRCEARSGNTFGGENHLKDGVLPRAPRLIWQAGDKEEEPVWSPENTGQNAGTPLQREISSLSLTMVTRGTLV